MSTAVPASARVIVVASLNVVSLRLMIKYTVFAVSPAGSVPVVVGFTAVLLAGTDPAAAVQMSDVAPVNVAE